MIGARKLLKESFSFLMKHPSLLVYEMFYFLPSLVSLGMALLFVISAGRASLVGLSFAQTMKLVFEIMFGSAFAIFVMCAVFFINIVISLGFTAYIQSLLAGTHASMIRSLNRAWNVCVKVPWVVPAYMAFFFFFNSPLWLPALIIFCYVHQLLLDGHTSFYGCFSESWFLFKKSFWTLVRFFVLIFISYATGAFLALLLLFLNIFLATLSLGSLALLFFSILISLGLFLFWTVSFIIFKIGINKLYLYVKQQKI